VWRWRREKRSESDVNGNEKSNKEIATEIKWQKIQIALRDFSRLDRFCNILNFPRARAGVGWQRVPWQGKNTMTREEY
jgi:hypothetical protein